MLFFIRTRASPTLTKCQEVWHMKVRRSCAKHSRCDLWVGKTWGVGVGEAEGSGTVSTLPVHGFYCNCNPYQRTNA